MARIKNNRFIIQRTILFKYSFWFLVRSEKFLCIACRECIKCVTGCQVEHHTQEYQIWPEKEGQWSVTIERWLRDRHYFGNSSGESTGQFLILTIMSFLLLCCLAFQMFLVSGGMTVKKIPKTCLDHMNDGAQKNGYFSVAGKGGKTLTVYCDFTSEPGSAWTLVMSWSLANKDVPAFKSEPFKQDVPLNEKTPNWVAYRMSKNEMDLIKSGSSHWRSTCSFDKFGVDYTDYMRGNFKDFDITTYLGQQQCRKVDYINIRGHIGYHSTVTFWQVTNGYLLHTDSSITKCSFNGKQGARHSEDNFGYYYTTNPAFRCTSGPSATTQYWFGSYI